MKDLLQSIVDSASAHADYADARHVHKRTEAVETRNGGVDRVANSDEEGIGVRVRIGGAWGFAATRGTDRPAAEEALARAIGIARAQPSAPATPLASVEPARGEHRAPQAGTDPLPGPPEGKPGVLPAPHPAG